MVLDCVFVSLFPVPLPANGSCKLIRAQLRASKKTGERSRDAEYLMPHPGPRRCGRHHVVGADAVLCQVGAYVCDGSDSGGLGVGV